MSAPRTEGGFFKSELGLRILSAIVLLIITIGISWLGGWPFLLLSFALSAVLFYEWQAIVRRTPYDATEVLLTVGFVGLMVSFLLGFFVYGLLAFLALGLLLEFTSEAEEKSDVRWIGLGALYCAIPAISFPIIREHGSFVLLMMVFCVVWATDIAAYFAGRQFGGPKLMPAVSPKKTWSGAMGGLLGAVVVGLIFQATAPEFQGKALWVTAALLSVASQIGDLFESWVKRKFGVKDSSQLIPGHGGFLDRVDGLVAAAFPVALSIWIA